MDNFIKWINKRDFDGVTLESVNYGADYFKTAPAVHFEAVGVFIPWESSYYRAASIEKQIIKYINRYGYTVYYRSSNLSGLYFTVCRPSDADALRLYDSFVEKSVRQWELIQHNYYIGRITLNGRTLNDIARNIMRKYEARYIETLKEAKTA